MQYFNNELKGECMKFILMVLLAMSLSASSFAAERYSMSFDCIYQDVSSNNLRVTLYPSNRKNSLYDILIDGKLTALVVDFFDFSLEKQFYRGVIRNKYQTAIGNVRIWKNAMTYITGNNEIICSLD